MLLLRNWQRPNRLYFFHHETADRIAGAERANQAYIATDEVLAVGIEGNHTACTRCVGILVEDNRRFVLAWFVVKQLFGGKHIHIDVGLMQPQAFEI